MFSSKCGPALYRAAMSERRFCFLLRCLRFDDLATREQRKENDKFAPIRKVWDLFIAQCKSGYTPGAHITIDEQLLGFRGRCPFRMYICNKPARYGIKIIMICDVETKYMLGAMPYLGKHTKPPQGMSLGHFVTLQLVEPYKHTNRNITGDNWFTSMQLVNDLLQNYGLTYVGTLRLNKPYTPQVMTDKKVIPRGCTAFLYDRALTMLSYHPDKKKTKFVQLMSTMHYQPVIEANGKPEVVICYNKTKGGVDAFDQMCARYSCSRKTKRWPLCVFYGMLNAAIINAWIIYNRMQKDRGQPEMERRIFMMKLAEDLIFPWAKDRMSFQGMHRSSQMTIKDVYSINLPHQQPAQGNNSMKRCAFCTRKKDRKTRQQCIHCLRPVCVEHAKPICCDCI
ncbi:piggyBac transposable element-derived protein 4-like [Macrobrachium rosenbergii]|uniref:piggyBac transposable element-derived protein 4-like n=1 Tax=Macrobrachium rosenbergii TaxID=79674 RepID=UPI0034D63558